MSDQPTAEILVIGIGNDLRGDDAVGLIVARRLQELALPGVTILEQRGEGTALMIAWQDIARQPDSWVILIDAVAAGSPPGTIHRLDAGAEPLPASLFPYSSHAFGVAGAVEVTRRLERLPAHLIIYGIEGRDYAYGVPLSPEVAAAVPRAAHQIAAECAAAKRASQRRPD